MKKLLKILNGKKTTIATILALIVTYLLTTGIISTDLAILINGIMVALGLTANYINYKDDKLK